MYHPWRALGTTQRQRLLEISTLIFIQDFKSKFMKQTGVNR